MIVASLARRGSMIIGGVKSNGRISEYVMNRLSERTITAITGLQKKLDARGNALEFATFGLNGKPIAVVDPTSGGHCARLVRRFDTNNKPIESQCFDASGQLIVEEKGVRLEQSTTNP